MRDRLVGQENSLTIPAARSRFNLSERILVAIDSGLAKNSLYSCLPKKIRSLTTRSVQRSPTMSRTLLMTHGDLEMGIGMYSLYQPLAFCNHFAYDLITCILQVAAADLI